MRVYVIHFETTTSLHGAFARLLQCDDVASCMIEPEHRRVRFVAPPKWAEPLVARLYQEGGLTWCSRHEVVSEGRGADLSRPRARHR